jgi:hypothetical protein
MQFPITVLLFNRPDETLRTLDSLLAQVPAISQASLTLSVDGFRGSRDEFIGRPDRTSEVAALARQLFPCATVLTHDHNLGIARHYHEAESRAFEDPSARWALFFEDDYVLGTNYIENLIHVVEKVDHDERVVVASATGDSWGSDHRGGDSLYPMNHAWAFALRRSHHVERGTHVAAYLASMDECRYFERDFERVTRDMASVGVLTLGTSQDYAKQAIRVAMGRVAVTTGRPHGRYIGSSGEHFTPEIFTKLGYDAQPCPSPGKINLPDITSELVEILIEEQRSAVAHEGLSLASGRVADASSSVLSELASRERTHEGEVDALCRRLASLETELRSMMVQLTSMTESTSWRVTKPLRAVRQLLPG